jgi:hypothetical protein
LLATISLQLDLRGDLHLGMPQRFRNPRRSQVTPETFTVYPIVDGMSFLLGMNAPSFNALFHHR